MSDGVKKPDPTDRDGWRTYWKQVQPPEWFERWGYWRTEPEISQERQAYLAERRTIAPDIARGVYPLRDENGSIALHRADIEWLLATLPGANEYGPIVWSAGKSAERGGVDLRGANLEDQDLSALPLAGLVGGFAGTHAGTQTTGTTREQRRMGILRLSRGNLTAAHLEGALLARAELREADLTEARLEQADLFAAHLEGANLTRASLAGTHLRSAFFDSSVYLHHATVGNRRSGGVHVADARWNNANLTSVDWSQASVLGEERQAFQRLTADGNPKSRARYLNDFERAVRANRQMSIELRGRGLNDEADRFAYKAQILQRHVHRLRRHYVRAGSSWLLDLISGYGYRPFRSVVTYAVAIIVFAALYWCVTNGIPITHGLFTQAITSLGMTPPPPPTYHLQGYEAVVVSMTSFHGRGFFQPIQSPGDRVAILSAVEAAVGLLIEIVFIATFTQRFFAR